MKLMDRILKLMRRADYVPLDARGLERNLQLQKRDRRKLELEIGKLIDAGQVVPPHQFEYSIP